MHIVKFNILSKYLIFLIVNLKHAIIVQCSARIERFGF